MEKQWEETQNQADWIDLNEKQEQENTTLGRGDEWYSRWFSHRFYREMSS